MQARSLVGVLETALYHDRGGREEVERFYGEHLQDAGVEIVHDAKWGDSARSFYFKDPAGNLLEIADRDFWPRPS